MPNEDLTYRTLLPESAALSRLMGQVKPPQLKKASWTARRKYSLKAFRTVRFRDGGGRGQFPDFHEFASLLFQMLHRTADDFLSRSFWSPVVNWLDGSLRPDDGTGDSEHFLGGACRGRR